MLRLLGFGFLLLGLVACGPEPDPTADPTGSPTASLTPVPTPVRPQPPALPDAARANTRAGAEAFVRHYVALVNYAQATGETAELAALGARTCSACLDYVRRVKSVYDSGGSLQSSGIAIRRAYLMRAGRDSWLVSVVAKIGPETMSAPGAPTTAKPGERTRLNFTVTYSRAWTVQGVVVP